MPRKSKKDEARVPAVEADAADGTLGSAPADDLVASEADADTSDVTQVVTFQLDGQLYGLPIEVVQEIQQLVEFTPLPDPGTAMLGLIDLRGTVVPALDLRTLVGLPPRDFTLETPMIFGRARGHVVCLIVDAVEDVVSLPAGGLQPPSALAALADRLVGMCRLPQGLVLVLDIERLIPVAALAAAEGGAA